MPGPDPDALRLPEALEQTLPRVAALMSGATDPWWIISSAAVALHGAGLQDVRDVDVLASASDAAKILSRIGLAAVPGGHDSRFRSRLFGSWREPPLPVEIMADFEVRTAAGWQAVTFETRDEITVKGHSVFVPSIAELKQLLLTFGRPKDLQRLKLLDGVDG